jgi:hypothetical protein
MNFPSNASWEGLEKKQFTRVVPSGANQRIGFFHAVNPDCTASGNVNVRIIKKPEHGTVETTPTMHFPNYPKESIRSKCNQHRVKGMQINYKSGAIEVRIADHVYDWVAVKRSSSRYRRSWTAIILVPSRTSTA